MQLSEIEKQKFKTMLMYAIRRKSTLSGGHNGFTLNDLQFILRELELEGKIVERPVVSSTHMSNHYFLKQ